MSDAAHGLGQEVVDLPLSPQEILKDYCLAYRSRQASLIGRREVMSGKAKFGIFGDGKELPQLAMARAFRPGDFRSGYYRDQTLMFALGELTIAQYFAQLYAHADVEADPATAGRAMNAHFATRSLQPDGSWKDLTAQYNSTPDLSPTAAQMPRLVGLAWASRLFRYSSELRSFEKLSHNGNEVAWGTIGNASTAEGMFWEALNAIGVLKSPAVVTIYDDGYGISVPNEYQMIKEDIGALLGGFQRKPDSDEGFDIYRIHGWNYPRLVEAYQQAGETARRDHIPAILHIIELTQPQGHSTSGSHERYKSPERLQWEQEFDGIRRMRSWISEMGLASPAELDKLEKDERTLVEEERKRAWQAFSAPILAERQKALEMISQLSHRSQQARPLLEKISANLVSNQQPLRRDTMAAVHQALRSLRDEEVDGKSSLVTWKRQQEEANEERYGSHLYSRSPQAARLVTVIPPVYSESSPLAYGYEVINACFDQALAREPLLVAFGEDVGRLGDVNQGFRGMQEKYGVLRVADTGIREVTIMGQAIGLALRGLRPIAEIQYLDYLLYALQLMSDDLATLHWRTAGGQKAPVIVRTRGHRLEGIWHSGSHMAGMLGLLRGMHLLTPRDMTRAAGFYNTLLLSDEPAVVVEVLNGYRVRERMPDNIGALILPIGVPEVLRPGQDLTIVTYGACCRIVMEAAESLDQVGITAEVIDVQSLLPFDLPGIIGESLQKTNRILFVDEDMPGGATAYMLQEVLEKQNGYFWLDSPPRTLAARPHRPAYGSDGDYWSKPNAEQVFDAAYAIMHEVDPARYPLFTH